MDNSIMTGNRTIYRSAVVLALSYWLHDSYAVVENK